MADSTHMDVSYIAHLARIHLADGEAELFQGQLDQVLTYVEQLGELDVSNVEPTFRSTAAFEHPGVNVLRADTPRPSLDHDAVIANAPAARDGQILVPKIME
jgi:aspartyl-tRNA(Asn)/glutamyl-tRNA(Gln) amidotransferase subunit C